MKRFIGNNSTVLAGFLAFGLMAFGPSTQDAYAGAKGVIELYTSQGCSSCPPADKLAEEYSKDPDLVVLTLPVTYWDYLGWKDTFAQKAFTNRQYAYAAKRGDRSVYTPQVVVNGYDHAVGSNARAINKLLKQNVLPVSIDISPAGDDVEISVEQKSPISSATLWMALFKKSATVSIGRGENRNRTITYTNVVKEMRPLGRWSGDAMTFKFAKPDLMSEEVNGFAVILQTKSDRRPSKILGAAAWVSEGS